MKRADGVRELPTPEPYARSVSEAGVTLLDGIQRPVPVSIFGSIQPA